MSSPRDFDLVLQGATGFTGRLATEEISRRAPNGFRWAIAGRDANRLQDLADRYDTDTVVADGLDPQSNDALASRTRVVLSCAGPFTRYGRHLVDACVAHGTHYADISGELPWIEELVQRHHADCRGRGITLIPASGFDSVPSDLGVFDLRKEVGKEVPIHGFFTLRGGFNGGTLHSGLALAEDHGAEVLPRASKAHPIFPIPALKRWATPFLMAPVNETIVARSHLLAQESGAAALGTAEYRESMAVRGRLKAYGIRFGLRRIEGMFGSRFGRSLLRAYGPQPGQGPSDQEIRDGFARLILLAGPLDAPIAQRTWSWQGDPSNRITVNCLVQTGLALAAGEATGGGVLTASTAFGDQLLQRLKDIDAVIEMDASI